jgi:arginine repressor
MQEPINPNAEFTFEKLKAEFQKDTGKPYTQATLSEYLAYVQIRKLELITTHLYAINENIVKGVNKVK